MAPAIVPEHAVASTPILIAPLTSNFDCGVIVLIPIFPS
jgi:hypothetical protein